MWYPSPTDPCLDLNWCVVFLQWKKLANPNPKKVSTGAVLFTEPLAQVKSNEVTFNATRRQWPGLPADLSTESFVWRLKGHSTANIFIILHLNVRTMVSCKMCLELIHWLSSYPLLLLLFLKSRWSLSLLLLPLLLLLLVLLLLLLPLVLLLLLYT